MPEIPKILILKRKINRFRKMGWSWNKISKVLGMARVTVRCYHDNNYKKQNQNRISILRKKYYKSTIRGIVSAKLRSSRVAARRRNHLACDSNTEDLVLIFVSKCQVCGKNCDPMNKICLDHCHETGKFRGWICNPCNRALGLFRHDIKILQSAMKYLERSK